MDFQGELRSYFQRVRPVYVEIYGVAYVITADPAAATRALQRAIYACWLQETHGGRRAGFRESLRRAARENALKEAQQLEGDRQELDWIALRLDDDPDEQLLEQALSGERGDMRWLLMLKFGCQLSHRAIARLTGVPERQVTEQLERFSARTRPRLTSRAKRHYEMMMLRVLRAEVIAQAAGMPDPMQVYRRLELEVSRENRRPHRRIARAANALLVVVLMLVCAALFWLVAVLMQPARTEAPSGNFSMGIEQQV